jgi:type I restriction enzyme, S subunit
MNPAQLLQHFDRISDAPDAIPRLRRFILDLAVQGKLVGQDPREELAPELLKRIQSDRAQLIKNRDSHAEPDEIWPIPAHWVFVPLELIAMPNGLFTDGDWVESKDQDPNGDVRLTQLADVGMGEYRNRSSRFMNAATAARLNCTFLKTGDILIARMPDPLGRACVFPGDPKPCVTVVDVAVLRLGSHEFNGAYVVYAINSPQFAKNVQSKAAGTTRSRISRGNLSALPFPLPPLAEQHRIVAKVDELMALCDRLEAAQVERESRRDRLAAASLHRLNNGVDPDAFRDHARFYFNQLPRLTTRTEHIQQLRQTILNLAVRGKLVPQDTKDEPVVELLRRIGAEKSQDEPFLIPVSWAWVSVDQVGDARLGKMLDKGENKGTPRHYIRNVNVRWFDFDLSDVFEMPFEDDELEEFALHRGDVLICEGGEPGRAAVWDEREQQIYFQKAIHRVRFSRGVSPNFFVNALRESADSGRLATYFTGVGIKHFTGKGLASFIFPLAPLAEQHRIVAKVDELMALCDRLEAQLVTTRTDSRRLLEAVLHEALAPAV